MKKLESLSPEQLVKMDQVKNKWLDYIFSCKNSLNREEAKISIDWLYKFCGLDAPIIIFVDSPMACQYATFYAKTLAEYLKLNPAQVRAQVGDQVWDQVRDQVWDQAWDQVGAQVGDQVWDQVGDQVRAQVWDQAWDQVGDQVRDQVRAQVRDQVGDQVGDQVRDQVRAQVRAQVGDQVWDQVWAQVRDQVGDQVRAQVGDQVRAQVWAQVRAQVRAQVGDQVWAQKIPFESFSSYGNIGDFGWVSFYDFFTEIGVLNNKDYNDFKKILSSGIYDMVQLNGFCIVSDMPNHIERNSNNLLHSIEDKAISFKDGYGQYYVNGRVLPEKYFRSISNGSYKMEDFIKETNEEYKSTCIAFMQEKFGDEYIVNFFRQNLKEIDTFVDKKDAEFLEGTTGGMNVGVYTLFKGEINNEKIAYVRCYCPSTDRMFFLGCDSKYNNVKDAIASLYRIPKKLVMHIESISRQGERFSTVLTEEGNEILKSLSEKEIADVSGITGENYFRSMRYEY